MSRGSIINTKSAQRIFVVIAILAVTGCGASNGGQAAPATTVTAESPKAQSTSSQTTGPATSKTTTTSPPSPTPPTTPSTTSTSPLPTADGPSENGDYSGNGPGVAIISTPPGEPSVLTFKCPTCSGIVKVTTDSYPPLIIDKTGPYSGEILLDTAQLQKITLTVTADAAWTARIVTLADHPAEPLATRGQGDTVVVITDPATSVALAHEGEGEFSVIIYNADGTSLTIHEMGPYIDSFSVNSPAIFSVIADGDWTITAS